MFTDDKTPDLLFNGVPFNKIPICHVCVTKNNCKFRINDADSTYFRPGNIGEIVKFFVQQT